LGGRHRPAETTSASRNRTRHGPRGGVARRGSRHARVPRACPGHHFNLFDNQDSIRNQDLVAGAGGNAFGDGIRFTPPRRVFLGARWSFGQ